MFRAHYCNLTCSINLESIILGMSDFQNIKKSTLDKIVNISHIKNYPKDTIIYYKNEVVSNVFYLFHGLVKMYKINKYGNEVIINLYANDCANNHSPILINYEAFNKNTSNNNLYCLQECRILQINATELQNIINEDIALQKNILQVANRVINKQEDIINLAMVYDSRAKIISFLLQNPDIFSMINKKTIAQILNISQETLSRTLKKLQEEGLIDITGKNVVINDYEKLSANI